MACNLKFIRQSAALRCELLSTFASLHAICLRLNGHVSHACAACLLGCASAACPVSSVTVPTASGVNSSAGCSGTPLPDGGTCSWSCSSGYVAAQGSSPTSTCRNGVLSQPAACNPAGGCRVQGLICSAHLRSLRMVYHCRRCEACLFEPQPQHRACLLLQVWLLHCQQRAVYTVWASGVYCGLQLLLL